MQQLINCFCPNTPVVLGVHHPLHLVRRYQFLLVFSLILFVYFQVVVVYIGWKANIAHGSKHLVLRISFLAVILQDLVIGPFECGVIVFIDLAHMLLVNFESTEVSGGMLLILLVNSLDLVKLLLLHLDPPRLV